RTLVHQEAPAYALHVWTPETGLITHFGTVEEPPATLRYQDWFQKILKHFEEEREQEPAYPGEAAKRSGSKAVYGGVAGVAALAMGFGLYGLFYVLMGAFGMVTKPAVSGEPLPVAAAIALLGVALPLWIAVWAFRRLSRR